MKLVLASYTAALQQTRQKAPPISKLFRILEFILKQILKFKNALTEKKKENINVAVEKQQRKSKAERKWKANE